jgi:hypothetical protein
MPYDFPISVEVDIAEPRINKDRLTVTAGGRPERQAWDFNVSTDVWRDPLRRRVMLPPLPTTPEWRTTTTGNYARLAKTDYTLTTSSAWVENHRGLSGNIYLEGNGTNERVTTASSYSADQPWFISIYVPGVESLGEQTILECGWGTYGGSTTVSLRFRANGAVSVWVGSTQIGYQDLDYAAAQSNTVGNSVGLSTVNILLLPVRQYDPDGNKLGGELMIVTDAMTAYVQGFADLATGDVIVPSGVFWWTVPIGRPSVQLAPVKFKTSGTLYGPVQKLRYAPASGRSFTGRGFYSMIGTTATATYAISQSDGSSYSPDGTIDTVRGKVTFANTSGVGSVCVEAVDWEMPRTVVDTNDSQKVNITAVVEQLDFSVDDQGVTTCNIRARRGALVTAGMSGYIEASDRPFRVFLTNPDTSAQVDLIRGVLSSPTWEPAPGTGNGDMDILTFEGKDRTAEFEYYTYGDTIADDGKLITDAIEDCVTGAGFDSAQIGMSTSTTRVAIGDVPMGEWSLLPQRGDSKRSHLDKIFDTYAANWYKGWVPAIAGYFYRAHAPSDLSATPSITLYEDIADAIAAGLTAAQGEHRTIRSLVRHGIPPEANQVVVLGMSPYTGRVILSQANATSSQTPNTAPSSRPVTWRGRVHRVLELDASLKTQAQADGVQSVLTSRLTSERYLIDWTSDFLVVASTGRPLWTGDVIRLYKKGSATYEDYRIVGMPRVDLVKMVTPAMLTAGDLPFYVADYRGERIAEGP